MLHATTTCSNTTMHRCRSVLSSHCSSSSQSFPVFQFPASSFQLPVWIYAVVGHVQWSGVCIVVIAHLCVSSYVRWASNGNMKQPLGVLVAGHFASEKNTTFFVFARTLHAPSASFFPAQETTIEHRTHVGLRTTFGTYDSWVKQNCASLSLL